MGATRTRGEVETEMKEMLGLVPNFFARIPDRFLEAEWDLFKGLELGETLIPNKYKELMGVAIHSETKCRYCILFHTECAKLFGATDEEIQEARTTRRCPSGGACTSTARRRTTTGSPTSFGRSARTSPREPER